MTEANSTDLKTEDRRYIRLSVTRALAMLTAIVAVVFAITLTRSPVAADEAPFAQQVFPPVGPNAREPFLFATPDGRLLMSWTEIGDDTQEVRVAGLSDGVWSVPRSVTNTSRLFVNWADFPSVAAFADGTLIAHWLQVSGGSTFDYDVKLALSKDDGTTWSEPVSPHQDQTASQHGFVTLMPFEGKVVAVWLDGRAYYGQLVESGAKTDQMQLRAAVISSDGTTAPDVALDYSTCSCCQTAAAVADERLLVVYRDRTAGEIRDISLVSLKDGNWSDPIPVHNDNWEIPGCPVNGPSIAANESDVVIAWFTGANDVPAVKTVLSTDGGANFTEAVRIDLGQPAGRVDTLMLDDGTALVSWIELSGSDEILMLCTVRSDGCDTVHRLTVNTASGSINFPQLAATANAIYAAWTQPLPNGSDTIRLVQIRP